MNIPQDIIDAAHQYGAAQKGLTDNQRLQLMNGFIMGAMVERTKETLNRYFNQQQNEHS